MVLSMPRRRPSAIAQRNPIPPCDLEKVLNRSVSLRFQEARRARRVSMVTKVLYLVREALSLVLQNRATLIFS